MKGRTTALLAAALSGAAIISAGYLSQRNRPLPVPVAEAFAAGARKAAVPPAAPAKPALKLTGPEQLAEAGQKLFAGIGDLEKGTVISLPLPGGGSKSAVLNYVSHYSNGAHAVGGRLSDGSGTFEIAREPWGYRGFILQKSEGIAYAYASDEEGHPTVATKPIGAVICEPEPGWPAVAKSEGPPPEKAAIYNGGRTVGIIYEAIPVLNSLPRAEATIYLDFDGEVIEGQSWEGGARIVAPAYNLPASEVTDMWRRVAEDYAPFEVNVTTDLQTYLRAPQGRRIRCITTTNNFASAGGVAFNNTFRESGDPVCWNFYRGNAGSVVISHEVGHTFNLSHDDTSTAGYYGGHGSGPTSWGPIMGAPYNQNVCQWSKGDYPDANQHQDDLLIIGSSVPRRLDDHSSNAADATPLTIGAGGAVSSSGVIESRDDIDAFVFTTGGGSVNLKFDGVSSSPNLDIEAKLYNSSGTLIATASPANQLNAVLTASVAAGTYIVTVDGVGNATWTTGGYDDYASIGGYTITGTIPSPSWRFRIPAYALNTAEVGTVAPGGSAYSIAGGNTNNAFSINPSTGLITVANAATLATTSQFNLTVSYTGNGSALSTTVPVNVAPVRGVKEEIWTGLSGSGMGSLTSISRYPNSPNVVRYAPTFQADYQADNFGEKLSAYLLPQETGSYTFWTTGDDLAELWLSTDSNPANKVRIAYNTSVTGPDAWTAQGTQQSAAISLVAGQRYYIEVLHREYGGDEHVSVAWQTPSVARALIPTQYLEYPGTLPNQTPWLANMTFRVREDSSSGTIVGTLQGGDFEPGSILSNYTITGGNTTGTFSLNATSGLLRVLRPLSFANTPKYYLDVRATDSGGITRTAQIAVEVEPLAVKREYYAGIGGNSVSNLTSSASYPGSPSSTSYVSFFEPPTDTADNYGERLSGYLRAPDSGGYTFWIASDDASELWLSTDSNPANKVRVAYSDSATGFREWGRNASQKSGTITLEAGRFYYVEVLHKEGVGGDHVSVSWAGPGFDQAILGAPHVTQQFYNHAAPVLDNKTVAVFDRDTQLTTLEAKDWADPGTKVTYSISGGNADGAFIIDPATGTISSAGGRLPTGTRVLTVTATDNSPTPLSSSASITINVQRAAMKREVWRGLPGGQALTDLTGWLYYPQAPDENGYTQNFKAPTNYGDNYGQRLSGYLIAPQTGSYTFWIASDDGGELWLATDMNPANKKRIASVSGSVNEEDWTAQAGQQSATVNLVAGQRYYVEALQKEGNGGDHLTVAWQGPGFTRTVIQGANLEYPDIIRPALRREIWNSGNAVAWTGNPATGAMDWVTAILSEAFENTGSLSGNASETGSATWGASSAWTRNNGVAIKSGDNDAVALLPFTPQLGKVYTLSLEIDPSNSPGSQDWFALGFLSQPATNTALYSQSSVFQTYGAPWVLIRANGNENGNTSRAFSDGVSNPVDSTPQVSAPGAYDTVAVVLDTRNATWTANYYFNGSSIGGHSLTSGATIRSVGFGAFATAKGSVRNFRVTTNDAPAPGSGNASGMLPFFKSPTDIADNFSERVSGFLVPPATGDYTFWLASDDDGELYLSSDDTPANLARIAYISGYVDPDAWDNRPSQKSATIRLSAGKRYYIEARHRDILFGDHLSVAWQGPGFNRQIIGNSALEYPLAPAERSLLRQEVWSGVGGNDVTNLTALGTYPGSPNTAGTLPLSTGFKTGTNVADNFGERISGYLVAPETGRYTFWIASDDASELWLSTNDHPTNRVKLANVSGSVAEQAWDSQASQKSVPVALEAGKRYYIEALHKEGVGGDHLSVAWQGPSFARQIIPNASLENLYSLPGFPTIKREVWTGLNGASVGILTTSSAFVAGTPASRGVLTAFDAPVNWGDNYGQRISSRLIAPESGNYKFWIASKDGSELWLSTDDNPANRIRIATNSGDAAIREWTHTASQESETFVLVAGKKYYLEVLHKAGVNDDHVEVSWQGPSFGQRILDGRFLEYPGTPTQSAALKREIWTGIGGNNVTDLTSKAVYPNSPNQTAVLNAFDAPVNWGDNYGQRISGYLIAPRTGDYQFWIASDDGSELWLATNGQPASKTRIAYVTNATGQQNWTSSATQASATISLTAGQRCYIEALHKEGGGDDYVSVAWQGPGFDRRIIQSQFLEYPGLLPGDTRAGTGVPGTSQDPAYTFWLNALGLTGNNRLATADPDGDGIPNMLEFVLGGQPAGTGAASRTILPEISVDDQSANFVFRRADVASGLNPFVEYGNDLDTWTRAINGTDGVQISTQHDFYGPGVDQVTVKVPRAADALFLRLSAAQP